MAESRASLGLGVPLCCSPMELTTVNARADGLWGLMESVAWGEKELGFTWPFMTDFEK